MKRKFSGSGKFGAAKWARRAVSAYRVGSRVARAFSGSRTQSRRGVRHAPGPITGESDYRGVYRRKPMPRRRKRAWVKFTRRVKAVQQKQLAPQFTVIRRSGQITSAINSQTANSLFTILGANGGNPETDDISDIINTAFAMGGNTGLAGVPVRESIRVQISGWLAECMINNNSGTTAYIDCYYWRCKKDIPRKSTDLTAGFTNLGDIITQGLNQISLPTNGPALAQRMDITDYGVTPFQCPLFSQCISVYKKTRIKVAPGGTAQLELRSGRNYFRKFAYDSNFCMLKYVTEGIYFVQYGTPNVAAATSSTTDISYSVNINYTWRRLSDDRMTGVVGDD